MKTQEELKRQRLDSATLCQFTGTEHYYRISRTVVITDGVRHLAEYGQAYWMIDAIGSHLLEIGTIDWFILVRFCADQGSALMIYEDGNGNELAHQSIPYTDFDFDSITLYACWDGNRWVIMLPSEY